MADRSVLSPSDPLVGRTISDRYKILGKLGEGGMGSVYLAEHMMIEKRVALKVLDPRLASQQGVSTRFLREAKSASRIRHENVIHVFDYGEAPDGHLFLVMELLEGADLAAVVGNTNPLPWERARGILLQVCWALRAAHRQHVVHRDLKPANVFLMAGDDGSDVVKLLDFGLAKIVDGPSDVKLTRTGAIFGTPQFMSPEQAAGKSADDRADIYAFGGLMHFLLTAEPPFKAESVAELMVMHLTAQPVPPSRVRPDLAIPPLVDHIVMKALEKAPDQRWRSIDDIITALSAVPTGVNDAPAPSHDGRTIRLPIAEDPAHVQLVGRIRRVSGWWLIVALLGGVATSFFVLTRNKKATQGLVESAPIRVVPTPQPRPTGPPKSLPLAATSDSMSRWVNPPPEPIPQVPVPRPEQSAKSRRRVPKLAPARTIQPAAPSQSPAKLPDSFEPRPL
jgi:serine/threonine protein kinase